MTKHTADRQDDVAEKFVNYMPGMPKLSREPGRIGRFISDLFRRRGALRPVGQKRSDE